MAANGTTNPIITEVLSPTNPIIKGRIAPPTMAVTIKPESSFERSGILSTVIEKMSGKILAKPRPIIKILISETAFIPVNNPNMANIEIIAVMIKNVLALIQLRITEPKKRPVIIAAKKNPDPATPRVRISMPNFSSR